MSALRKLAVAIALSITLGACYARVGGDRMLNPPKPPVVTCQEDDPCWNCHTMGNLICGEEKP